MIKLENRELAMHITNMIYERISVKGVYVLLRPAARPLASVLNYVPIKHLEKRQLAMLDKT